MKISVCIGSSCHIKGSHQVVDGLRTLIAQYHVSDQVELAGNFCLGSCQLGVCVTIGEKVYSVSPETVEEFFKTEVLSQLNQ
ncbi:MAG: (2Fe-2S) ferredoxin domain-containing protein [Ruminococcaceae bacterium]|nr:(2Fe-2S) ferredoxin domain-containing protein [Oscillospiraceae bacterium]